MDARVTKLEDALQGINVSLATISEQLKHVATQADMQQLRVEIQAVRTDNASLVGKLDSKAGAVELGTLQGKVGRIPTVPVIAGILAVLTAIAAAWPWIKHQVVG